MDKLNRKSISAIPEISHNEAINALSPDSVYSLPNKNKTYRRKVNRSYCDVLNENHKKQ